jgi:hypothetical protein
METGGYILNSSQKVSLHLISRKHRRPNVGTLCKISYLDFSLKKKNNMAGGTAQVEECLPSKREDLSSNPSTKN